MQKNGPVYAGIDIGTTNVRTVIGVVGDDDLTPTIVGAGSPNDLGQLYTFFDIVKRSRDGIMRRDNAQFEGYPQFHRASGRY